MKLRSMNAITLAHVAFAAIAMISLIAITLGLVALLASKKDVVMKVSGKEFSLQTTTPEGKGSTAP